MKRTLLPLFVMLAGLTLLLPQSSTGQNDDAVPQAEEKKDYRGPLPYYFGKLGVDDAQKEKLYDIDDEYTAKIEALEKQVEKLKDERDAKMETLLTPGQKLRLKELREAAAKRQAKEDDQKKTAVSTPDTE